MRRRKMITYGLALLVAALVVGAGFVFVRQTHNELQERFTQVKQQLKTQQAEGKLPPDLQGVDIDTLEPTQFGVRLPADFFKRLMLADLLAAYRLILIPLVFALCLGLALLVDKMWLSRA
jgi:hypothetical protein